MITVLRRWWHGNFPLICVFSYEKWWNEKKNGFEKKVSILFLFFFFISWKFFRKIGQLARILWNRVFRGKELRKRLAATETAAEIDEDYFQRDHRDTDDDDVPTLSSSVAPQNVTCPPPSNKKTKIDKEKRFRWTSSPFTHLRVWALKLIWCSFTPI